MGFEIYLEEVREGGVGCMWMGERGSGVYEILLGQWKTSKRVLFKSN